MKLEITKEQFDLIQIEIIKCEEELMGNRDTMSTWEHISLSDYIITLKEILNSEEIDLDRLN